MNLEEATKIVNDYFQLHYGISLSDLEITETPGYWRSKKPCDPNTCHSPIHSTLFNEGGIKHTYSFNERGKRDERSLLVPPFRCWRMIRGATIE
ncbi:MAG: hypothetical protein WAW23_08350 [Candidatus Methanoperedens sp.]